MEKTGRQIFVGYQMHSLIEFMLGDDTRPGWLDKQSHSRSSSSNGYHETSAVREWRQRSSSGIERKMRDVERFRCVPCIVQQACPEKNVFQEKAKSYYEWYQKARLQKQIVLGREKDLDGLKEQPPPRCLTRRRTLA